MQTRLKCNVWKTTGNNGNHRARNRRNALNTRKKQLFLARKSFFCLWKPRFVKKIAFFCKPSLSISDAFSTSRTTTSTHWKLQQFFKLPHVDQDLKKCLKQKNRGLPGSLFRKFSCFWRKRAKIKRHYLRISNSSHVAPRAPPTTSLAPLESLVQALSNGARLEVGGARGAEFLPFENARKHAKIRKILPKSF